MRKKQKFSLFLTALMLCGGIMQAQEMGLFVYRDAGAPQSFALSGIGKITFSEGKMVVSDRAQVVNDIAFSAISRLTFGAVTSTVIGALETSALRLYPNPVRDELFVTSDAEIESIAVFGLAGNVLLRTDVQAREARLSLGFLPAGTYVIQLKRADAISSQKIIKN